jgi:hypothetical protein
MGSATRRSCETSSWRPGNPDPPPSAGGPRRCAPGVCSIFERVAKTWILDTETKGTGARMVPLDSVSKRRSPAERLLVAGRPSVPREHRAPAPRPRRRFRIVDVMTRQTIADDVDAREAVTALQGMRRNVDVTVSTWQEDRHRWRPLTLDEQRALWDLAHDAPR